jgi:hypothetical protein
MPFDSRGLQFASSSLNLPEHNNFSAAFLTAQEIVAERIEKSGQLMVAA